MSVEEQRQIDQICTLFESLWTSSSRIEIEQCLKDSSEYVRCQLLEELVRTECELHLRDGQVPLLQRYLERFPDFEHAIRNIFESFPQSRIRFSDELHSQRYTVLDEIARGGMGIIFRALDVQFKRPIAIKIIREIYAGDLEAIARFDREARICGSLQHPGIVPVYDKGKLDNGQPFFAMKLIEGVTFAEKIHTQDESRKIIELLEILKQVCNAVALAHNCGIVHRDLKPANVMVGQFGEVYVMDWGLAGLFKRKSDIDLESSPLDSLDSLDASQFSASSHHGMVGTMPYLAPEYRLSAAERVQHKVNISPRQDVYSLGAILLEILTGKPPKTNASHRSVEAREAADGDEPSNQSTLQQLGIDPLLIELVTDCLSDEVEQRPQNAGQFAARLENYFRTTEQRMEDAKLAVAASATRLKLSQVRLRNRVTVLVLAIVGLTAFAWSNLSRYRVEREAEMIALRAMQQANADFQAASASGSFDAPEWELAHRSLDRAYLYLDPQRLQVLGEQSRKLLLRIKLFRNLSSENTIEYNSRLNEFNYGIDAQSITEAFELAHIDPEQFDPTTAAELISDYPEGAQRLILDTIVRMIGADLQDSHAWWTELAQLLERRLYGTDSLSAIALGDRVTLEQFAVTIEPTKSSPSIGIAVARGLQMLGNSEASCQILIRFRDIYLDDFWINTHLGVLLLTKPQPEIKHGLTCLYSAAALKTSPGSQLNLGMALLMDKQLEAATQVFENILEKSPENFHAMYYLAKTHRAMGDYGAAEVALHRLAKLRVSESAAVEECAKLYMATNRVSEASDWFQLACRRSPDKANLWRQYCHSLTVQNRFSEAVVAIERAIALEPHQYADLFQHAYALERLGLYRAAKDVYGEAHQLKPDDAQVLCNLGNASRMLGEFDIALDFYQQGRQLASPSLLAKLPIQQWLDAAKRDVADAKIFNDYLQGTAANLERRIRGRIAMRIAVPLRRWEDGLQLLFDNDNLVWNEPATIEEKLTAVILAANLYDDGVFTRWSNSLVEESLVTWFDELASAMLAAANGNSSMLSPAQAASNLLAWRAEPLLLPIRDPKRSKKFSPVHQRRLLEIWQLIDTATQ